MRGLAPPPGLRLLTATTPTTPSAPAGAVGRRTGATPPPSPPAGGRPRPPAGGPRRSCLLGLLACAPPPDQRGGMTGQGPDTDSRAPTGLGRVPRPRPGARARGRARAPRQPPEPDPDPGNDQRPRPEPARRLPRRLWGAGRVRSAAAEPALSMPPPPHHHRKAASRRRQRSGPARPPLQPHTPRQIARRGHPRRPTSPHSASSPHLFPRGGRRGHRPPPRGLDTPPPDVHTDRRSGADPGEGVCPRPAKGRSTSGIQRTAAAHNLHSVHRPR